MMNTNIIREVLKVYGITDARLELFNNGLINSTWKVTSNDHHYILQKINDHVFKKPQDIGHNIRLIADYLHKNHSGYFFVRPVVSNDGRDIIFMEEEGWFRLFPFVEGSHTENVALSEEQACEAAVQYGKFTRLLSGFDAGQLKTTIPHFHDLELRYQQFLQAIKNGDEERKVKSKKLIDQLIGNENILHQYRSIIQDTEFKLRVTHHDTKISNVLFDEKGKAICVIDLDTIMPGYFISDVGDMIRTYVSPANEEETDLNKIVFRKDFYKAIVRGYEAEMKDELTSTEKRHFLYAGKFMIYMQALRFLTDYLDRDVYYGAKYPQHNFDRAMNQVVLLQALIEYEKQLVY